MLRQVHLVRLPLGAVELTTLVGDNGKPAQTTRTHLTAQVAARMLRDLADRIVRERMQDP